MNQTTHYKSLQITHQDHNLYDEIRKDFAARKGVPEHMITIEEVLRVGMKFYQQRVGTEFRSKKV